MKTAPDNTSSSPDFSGLRTAEMMAVISDLQQQLASQEEAIRQRDVRIAVLEELLRLKKIQQFGASSEKQTGQISLFNEAELEAEIDALRDQLPTTILKKTTHHAPPASVVSAAFPTSCCASALS